MEQGSSLNQRMQLYNEQSLAHDQLNPPLHSSSQELTVHNELNYGKMGMNEFQSLNFELLASPQSNQPQVGTSFSGVPLPGDLLPQFGGGYEDIPTTYNLQGLPHSHDQQIYNQTLEFNFLPSSSTHNGSSKTLVQFGADPSIDVSMQNTAQKSIALENPFPSRSIANQDTPYSMSASNDLELGIGSPSNPTPSALKRKSSWPDDETPSNGGWNLLGRRYQRYSSRSFESLGGRYSLYDKRYEDIGLPVDPHLRIFNATNANGNGESSTKKI